MRFSSGERCSSCTSSFPSGFIVSMPLSIAFLRNDISFERKRMCLSGYCSWNWRTQARMRSSLTSGSNVCFLIHSAFGSRGISSRKTVSTPSLIGTGTPVADCGNSPSIFDRSMCARLRRHATVPSSLNLSSSLRTERVSMR